MARPESLTPAFYYFDDVAVDRENFRLVKGDEIRALEPRAFDLLIYLIERRGRLVEKQELFEKVWKEAFVTDNALTRAVKEIRRAIGDDASAPRYIETLPKRGYRFMAEVKTVSETDSTPRQAESPGSEERADSQSSDAAIRKTMSAPRVNVRLMAYGAFALAVVALIAIGLQALFRSASAPHAISSLAVLPFSNGSADPNSDYLSDGITESIINSLSQVSELKVMARTTAFRYKGKDADPQTVGRELKVEGVLTGKVTQQGDSLLVQAELVSAADGTELWGERYSRKMSDILAVQEEIARQISERLRLKLTGDEAKRLARSYTANTEAYQLYLKGRYYWNKRTEESYQKAIEYFRQAIERDRKYALAYTGLADCYSFLSSQGIRPPREVFPLAKNASETAIALDDTLAEAHTSLAYVKLYYDWDWKGAEQEYNRAINLNPNYATPHHGYAYFLISTGRTEEAIAEIQRAEDIDPLSLIINTDHGEFYYFARRPDRAIAQLQKAIEMEPTFIRAHFLLARAYVQNGQCNDAIAEFQKARSLATGEVEMLGALGQGYASCGKRPEAQRVINDLVALSKQHYISPHWLAATYAGLGEIDESFDWLDKTFETRFGPLI